MSLRTVQELRENVGRVDSGSAGSLCLFSSYFVGESIPHFVRYYLQMLRPHFEYLVFLTNDDRELDAESVAWLAGVAQVVMPVRNEGYDFGMWQKVIRELGGLSAFSRVALVNDSCICFAPLDPFFHWVDATGAEAAGMVLSNEHLPHLQSYFMVFSGAAIPVVERHVLSIQVVNAGYDDVVRLGELGLSRALHLAGIPLLARYSPPPDFLLNASFACCDRFIDDGMPVIKRKALHYPFGFVVRHAIREGVGFHPLYYINKIRVRHADRADEIDRLFVGQFVPSIKGAVTLYRRAARYLLFARLVRLRERLLLACRMVRG